jgi:hypothetical protein
MAGGLSIHLRRNTMSYVKYKYIPNCVIIDYEKLRRKFVFDENGEFVTNDPKLIAWIKKHKPFLKPIPLEDPFLRALYAYQKARKDNPDVTASDIVTAPPPPPEHKTYKCRECGKEFTNPGQVGAHMRKEHPKPKEEA